jgi:glutathione S-transferase
VGRIAYALGYYRDPAKREIGFITGMLACALLIGGTVWGLLLR